MNIVPPNAIASPQQPQSQQSQGSTSSTGSLPTAQSKTESLDNIAKVKSLAGPLRDSLAVSSFVLFKIEFRKREIIIKINFYCFALSDDIKNRSQFTSVQ